MLKKLLKTKSKKVIIAYIIIVLLLLGSVTTVTVNIVLDVQKRYAARDQAVSFDIHDVNLNIAETTIVFYDEDGLKQVTTPDNVIECSNRTTLYVDRDLVDRTNYQFKIIDNNNNEETIDIYFEVPRIEDEYVLNDGVYVLEPYTKKLEKGYTRYLYQDDDGNLVPGNWLSGEEPANWYSYRQSKWANIYSEANGNEAYYVWIPRYCYKLSDTTGETVDVRFINMENEYKYIDGGTEVTMTWDELQAYGYQIPDAFYWDKNNSQVEDIGEQLPGYWSMKYVSGIYAETYTKTVNYDIGVRKGSIFIKNIAINNSDETVSGVIDHYIVALNGIEKKRINDITSVSDEDMRFEGLVEGDNYISLTAFTENNEIIGSMTLKYEYKADGVAVNPPDTSKFNQDTTFYVTWDENEKEHSTIPLTKSAPENWYNYSDAEWANVVTRNNGGEIYYVWIPRYEYKVEANEKTIVKFLSGTTTQTTEGYQIPEAFWWDKNNNGVQDEGEQLTGYWSMKYVANTSIQLPVKMEVSATNSSITIQNITGGQEGYVYKVYVNGNYDGSITDIANPYIINYENRSTSEALKPNVDYAILLEIRDSDDNYVSSALSKIQLAE